MASTRFLVDITSQTIEVTADEVWPAGDAPEHPTPEDVAKALRGVGSRSTLSQWGANSELIVTITQPGEPTAAEVWV